MKVENDSEQKALLGLVKKLNKREKIVLQLRYGLMNSPERTQREIAKVPEIPITSVRVIFILNHKGY